MKALLAVTVAIGFAIGLAPVASADEGDYLDLLQPRLTFLTKDQLLNEGYRVCRYVSVGRPSSDAIPVVMNDLQVSVAAAYALVPAALEHLDC
ncbi:MAG: hypothetical protein JWR11_6110 [Mycobacterium sp.]|jgi:hypothetical protein|nr:hypothetical protein [Mycobacterium sp.]MDT5180271.1 hypothetical protein [Mycobacterium sp.]